MARPYLIVAFVTLASYAAASADANSKPPFFYPAEHRTDLRALQEEAALQGYELQIVRRDTDDDDTDVIEIESAPPSILSFIWDLLPAPVVAIKSIVIKIAGAILKLAKLLIPVKLVLLGMGLVVGFCAFTPYCTLIIEEPIASKIRAFKDFVPFVDEVEYHVYDGIQRIHALQG